MFWIKFIVLVITGVYIMYWDFKEHRIPNKVNLVLLFFGVLISVLEYDLWLNHVLGFVILGSIMLGLSLLPGGFGMGDVKYVFTFGLILGLNQAWKAFIIGILLGGIVSAVLLALKKASRKDHIAYGPYLVLGTWLSFFI